MISFTPIFFTLLALSVANAAPVVQRAATLAGAQKAQALNKEFSTIKPDDACTENVKGCVQGGTAVCNGQFWETKRCADKTERCFFLPSLNGDNTTFECTTEAKALATITTAGATGGISGDGAAAESTPASTVSSSSRPSQTSSASTPSATVEPGHEGHDHSKDGTAGKASSPAQEAEDDEDAETCEVDDEEAGDETCEAEEDDEEPAEDLPASTGLPASASSATRAPSSTVRPASSSAAIPTSTGAASPSGTSPAAVTVVETVTATGLPTTTPPASATVTMTITIPADIARPTTITQDAETITLGRAEASKVLESLTKEGATAVTITSSPATGTRAATSVPSLPATIGKFPVIDLTVGGASPTAA